MKEWIETNYLKHTHTDTQKDFDFDVIAFTFRPIDAQKCFWITENNLIFIFKEVGLKQHYVALTVTPGFEKPN